MRVSLIFYACLFILGCHLVEANQRILAESSYSSSRWQFDQFSTQVEQNMQTIVLPNKQLLFVQSLVDENEYKSFILQKYERDETKVGKELKFGDQNSECLRPKVVLISNIGFALGWIEKQIGSSKLYIQIINFDLDPITQKHEINDIHLEVHWDFVSEFHYLQYINETKLLILYKGPNQSKIWNGVVQSLEKFITSDIYLNLYDKDALIQFIQLGLLIDLITKFLVHQRILFFKVKNQLASSRIEQIFVKEDKNLWGLVKNKITIYYISFVSDQKKIFYASIIFDYQDNTKTADVSLIFSKEVSIAVNQLNVIVMIQKIESTQSNQVTILNYTGQIQRSFKLFQYNYDSQGFQTKITALSNNNFIVVQPYYNWITVYVYDNKFSTIINNNLNKHSYFDKAYTSALPYPSWEYYGYFQNGQIQLQALEDSFIIVGVDNNINLFNLVQLNNKNLEFIQQRIINYDDLNIYRYSIQRVDRNSIFVQWIDGQPETLIPQYKQNLYLSELNLQLNIEDCGIHCDTCQNDVCTQCKLNFSLVNNDCKPQCIQNCQKCSNLISCEICQDGYILTNMFQCVQNNNNQQNSEFRVSLSETTYKENVKFTLLPDRKVVMIYYEYNQNQQFLQLKVLNILGETILSQSLDGADVINFDIFYKENVLHLYLLKFISNKLGIIYYQLQISDLQQIKYTQLYIYDSESIYLIRPESNVFKVLNTNQVFTIFIQGGFQNNNYQRVISYTYDYNGQLINQQCYGEVYVGNIFYYQRKKIFDAVQDDVGRIYVVLTRECESALFQLDQFGKIISQNQQSYGDYWNCRYLQNPSVSIIPSTNLIMIQSILERTQNFYQYLKLITVSIKLYEQKMISLRNKTVQDINNQIYVFKWREDVLYSSQFNQNQGNPQLKALDSNSFVLIFVEYHLDGNFQTLNYLHQENGFIKNQLKLNQNSIQPGFFEIESLNNNYLFYSMIAFKNNANVATNQVYLQQISIKDDQLIGLIKICDDTCSQCDNNLICSQCKDHYQLNDQNKCQLICLDNCSYCEKENECEICNEGYQLNNDRQCIQAQQNSYIKLEDHLNRIESNSQIAVGINGNIIITWMEYDIITSRYRSQKLVNYFHFQFSQLLINLIYYTLHSIRYLILMEFKQKTSKSLEVLKQIYLKQSTLVNISFYPLFYKTIIQYLLFQIKMEISLPKETWFTLTFWITRLEININMTQQRMGKIIFSLFIKILILLILLRYNQNDSTTWNNIMTQKKKILENTLHIIKEQKIQKYKLIQIISTYNIKNLKLTHLDLIQQLHYLPNQNITFLKIKYKKQVWIVIIKSQHLNLKFKLQNMRKNFNQISMNMMCQFKIHKNHMEWIKLMSPQIKIRYQQSWIYFIYSIIWVGYEFGSDQRKLFLESFSKQGVQLSTIQVPTFSNQLSNPKIGCLENGDVIITWQDNNTQEYTIFAVKYNKHFQPIPLSTVTCMLNCETCMTTTSCSRCSEGYYFDGSECKVICGSGCQQCLFKDICDICYSGYYLFEQKCQQDQTMVDEQDIAYIEDYKFTKVTISAFSDSSFVVVWNNKQNSIQQLYFQFYDNNRQKQGDVRSIYSKNDRQYAQTVTLANDQFAVVWFEGDCSIQCRLVLQIYNKDLNEQITEITIDTVTLPTLYDQKPVILRRQDNRLIIAYILYQDSKTKGYYTIYEIDTFVVKIPQIIENNMIVDNLDTV